MIYQNWQELESACKNCEQCDLARTRTNLVFGIGNPHAEILFIGEGPGEQEDLKGEPFVGRSGQLLDKMLDAIDLDRHQNIYIANIVKCRPPKNRDPLPEEQEKCILWLRAQTALLHPKIIVCLGRIAAMRIMDSKIKITRQHGQWIQKGSIWMMATLHPAALLRDPRKKPEAFEDFLGLRDKIQELDINIGLS
ncbi:MAG: uracil-DNA glycosylase [Oscillospiraceae bacterium]|nr:uracil-DNA glycosylase [Oscillospiraceae bacterium]